MSWRGQTPRGGRTWQGQNNFDLLMAAVIAKNPTESTVQHDDHQNRQEGRPPLSARTRQPLSPVCNTRITGKPAIGLPLPLDRRARPTLEEAVSGRGTPRTPRDIMSTAVRELPSLTDTLQEGRWITPQDAAGLARVPRAPGIKRPFSARHATSVAPSSMRPLSARAKFCSQPASASEDQERARVDDAAHKERQAWARERPAQPPEAAGRTCATSDGGGDSGGDGPIGLGNRHSNKPQEVVVAASTPDNWKQCFHAGALVKIIQDLCSLGQSSKTNDAIQSTRGLVQRSLDCEGCSVFLVQGEKGLICNSISAPALPKSMGVVSRVAQGLAASINVSNENKCDFFDERIDRDPDLKIRVGKGLLAQGVFSSCGKVVGVILAVGKVRGPSFDTTDEGILKAIAIQVGMILGLCKTARKMEGKFHEGERDKRFAKALNDCKTSSSVQVLVQQYVKELTDATSVEFFTAEVFARVQSMDGSDDPVTHENHPVDTATRAFRSGRAFVIEDLSVHDQYRHLRRQHNFARSVMSIPMRVGPNGKILGVIQARNDDAFKFSHHQAEQMEPMLFMMTKELERIMMWDNTLKLQKRLPLVFTAREIFGTLFVAEDVAREVLNAKSACVYVFNQTSNRIWTAHPTSSERDEFDADLGIVGDCLRRNELMQVSNALHDARYFEPIDGNKCMDLGTHHRHMLLAPIRALKDKRLLGVLVISRDQSQSFSNIDETFAKVIAITLAAAFEVCMEHEIYEVALKDNRTIMRLAATMQHNNRIPDLAQATILGTLEAMQASECIVLLKPEANERIQAFKEEEDISKVKLRKFSLFDGQLEEDIVQWDDAVIEQSILKGRMVNVTSQRMLNAIGYKRLHRLSAISGAHSLPSQLDRQPDELLLGPTMCTPLFTGLDQGQVFGAIQIRRPVKAAVFTESEEQKFRYFCQHASSAFRRTFEQERLIFMIENHQESQERNIILCNFLDKIHDSADLQAVTKNIVAASKALGCCAGANFYRVEQRPARQNDASNTVLGSIERPTNMESEQFVTEIRMGTEIHERSVSIGSGIPGEVRRRGDAVLVNTPAQSAFFDAQVDDPRDGGVCRNALGLPVFNKDEPGKILGVLVLFNALAKTKHGLGERNFDQGDVERFRAFTLWIALLLKRSRELTVPVATINAVLDSATNVGESDDMLNPNHLIHNNVHAWQAISETVKTHTHCQTFVAFRVVPEERDVIECIFPAQAAGHRLVVSTGIMQQAIENKVTVNVYDSIDDERISAECDSMDFLKIRWDAGDPPLLSPGAARYGDGKLSVRKSVPRHARVEWENALVVPMLNQEARVTGLALAVNKSLHKGPFDSADISLVKALITMAGQEDRIQSTQRNLNDAIDVRRSLIKEAGAMILNSSETLTSTEMYTREALTNMLRITRAKYGAIYLLNPGSESSCIKYDSQGAIGNEKRTRNLPWAVMDTGSPINLRSASDLEASGVIPSKPFGTMRSIIAEPLVVAGTIKGVLLVAWKADGTPFDEQDEFTLHDFAVLFGSTHKLLASVEELVSVIEIEMAIPRNTIPALRSLIPTSPTGEKRDNASVSPVSKR